MKWMLGLLFCSAFTCFSQEAVAYQLFDKNGKRSSYTKMLKAIDGADIVLFGELHDDPIAHWMQLLVARHMFEKTQSNFVLGAEMFERDQQERLNRYLSGKWELKTFTDSTKMWSNFSTDYLPVVDFAKENKIPYVATNIPRPYASKVFKKGLASLDTLPAAEKQWIVPLPFTVDTTLSQYKELIEMGKEMHASGIDFAYAQAIKDATMAYSILQNWKPGNKFLHFNGSYHSDFHQSIVWYLRQANPKLKIITISTVNQDAVNKLEEEHRKKGDFILVVPNGMTRTM